MLIGEVARRAGTTTRALRYYEECGLLTPRRSSAGYRIYDDDAVWQVRAIRSLLEAGFNSQTVALLLPCARPDASLELCPRIEAAMRDTLSGIESELTALAGRRDAVRQLLS